MKYFIISFLGLQLSCSSQIKKQTLIFIKDSYTNTIIDSCDIILTNTYDNTEELLNLNIVKKNGYLIKLDSFERLNPPLNLSFHKRGFLRIHSRNVDLSELQKDDSTFFYTFNEGGKLSFESELNEQCDIKFSLQKASYIKYDYYKKNNFVFNRPENNIWQSDLNKTFQILPLESFLLEIRINDKISKLEIKFEPLKDFVVKIKTNGLIKLDKIPITSNGANEAMDFVR
jgi:hypothetical protein